MTNPKAQAFLDELMKSAETCVSEGYEGVSGANPKTILTLLADRKALIEALEKIGSHEVPKIFSAGTGSSKDWIKKRVPSKQAKEAKSALEASWARIAELGEK